MRARLTKYALKHRIADEIKRMIFSGELKPGEKITELELAKEFDVSRTSIRESILLLELEGIIVSSPYRETRVATITQEEVLEILIPIRIDIEVFSLHRSRPFWSEDTKKYLWEIIADMRTATANDDLSEFIDADIRFHELIVKSCQLESVIKIWESIVYRIRLHFINQNYSTPKLSKWLKEHEDLGKTITDKNVSLDNACAALKEHIIGTNLPDVYSLSKLSDNYKEE